MSIFIKYKENYGFIIDYETKKEIQKTINLSDAEINRSLDRGKNYAYTHNIAGLVQPQDIALELVNRLLDYQIDKHYYSK